MSERRVRVRFAPSPTGALHIGGVRTALYNYLFARQHQGDLVFRIEDTDSTRFVPGAEEYIIESFKWLGIQFDEGVSFGGDKGPYRQSERREIYKKYVQQLLDAGKAYIAFDTPQELEAKRAEIQNFQYDCHTRSQMRNSLTLPKEEVEQLIAGGQQYVVRFKIEAGQEVLVNDLIRGEVRVKSDILDDKVLFKSADQLPTYHLANIVDDHLMEISHVIRGEEWLPSAPLHVLLYQAFGWEDTMPMVRVNSPNAMAIVLASPCSLCCGKIPSRGKPLVAIVRMAISQRPSLIFWPCWDGIPERSRNYLRLMNSYRSLISPSVRRQVPSSLMRKPFGLITSIS